MLLIHMWIREFCPCFFCCFSLGWVSRMIGKHNSRLWARILYHHLQFLVLLWIAASAYTGLGNAQHSAGNNAQQRTLTLLSPNLTSGNPSVISCLDFLVSISFWYLKQLKFHAVLVSLLTRFCCYFLNTKCIIYYMGTQHAQTSGTWGQL